MKIVIFIENLVLLLLLLVLIRSLLETPMYKVAFRRNVLSIATTTTDYDYYSHLLSMLLPTKAMKKKT